MSNPGKPAAPWTSASRHPAGARCAALSTRIVYPRSKPTWPGSASAPRVRKKGRTPTATTLFWAGWVLVFTTVAPSVLCAKTISALYRVRWQVEIAIKRWKSVLDVGKLRAKAGSPLAEVWLLGKLLYAMVVERRARRHLGVDWSRLDGERRGTFWRVWQLIQDEVRVHILGVEAWREEGWQACGKVIMERPRRRKLQRLPDAVIDMYHSSDQEELREAA